MYRGVVENSGTSDNHFSSVQISMSTTTITTFESIAQFLHEQIQQTYVTEYHAYVKNKIINTPEEESKQAVLDHPRAVHSVIPALIAFGKRIPGIDESWEGGKPSGGITLQDPDKDKKIRRLPITITILVESLLLLLPNHITNTVYQVNNNKGYSIEYSDYFLKVVLKLLGDDFLEHRYLKDWLKELQEFHYNVARVTGNVWNCYRRNKDTNTIDISLSTTTTDHSEYTTIDGTVFDCLSRKEEITRRHWVKVTDVYSNRSYACCAYYDNDDPDIVLTPEQISRKKQHDYIHYPIHVLLLGISLQDMGWLQVQHIDNNTMNNSSNNTLMKSIKNRPIYDNNNNLCYHFYLCPQIQNKRRMLRRRMTRNEDGDARFEHVDDVPSKVYKITESSRNTRGCKWKVIYRGGWHQYYHKMNTLDTVPDITNNTVALQKKKKKNKNISM